MPWSACRTCCCRPFRAWPSGSPLRDRRWRRRNPFPCCTRPSPSRISRIHPSGYGNSLFRIEHSEMEFLNISLTKTRTLHLFKNTYKKNPRNKKTWVYSWIAFRRKEKLDKNSSLRRLKLMPSNLDWKGCSRILSLVYPGTESRIFD